MPWTYARGAQHMDGYLPICVHINTGVKNAVRISATPYGCMTRPSLFPPGVDIKNATVFFLLVKQDSMLVPFSCTLIPVHSRIAEITFCVNAP